MTNPLWRPEKSRAAQTTLAAFSTWMASRTGKSFDNYDDLHRYSIADPAEFWSSFWDFAKVIGDKGKPLTEPAKETIAVQYIATPALVQTAHVQSLPTTSRSHCQMMPVTSPSISSTATQISARR